MTTKQIDRLYGLKELAVEHLRAGRYQQSSVYFKDILEKFQDAILGVTSEDQMQKCIRELELSAHKNLSLCYLKCGKYGPCRKECEAVLQIEPSNVKILFRVGKAYLQEGRLGEAEVYLKRGFHLDPQEKEIMKALEIIETKSGRNQGKQTHKRGFLAGIIMFLLSMVLWLPAFVYQKGKRTVSAVFRLKNSDKAE